MKFCRDCEQEFSANTRKGGILVFASEDVESKNIILRLIGFCKYKISGSVAKDNSSNIIDIHPDGTVDINDHRYIPNKTDIDKNLIHKM